MASLGWLLNLGFAGSGEGALVGPFVGSLLLLGVGRMWWLPVVWPLLTGRAYAGELEGAVEVIEPLAYIAGGGLAAYGAIGLRDWLRSRRRRKLVEALATAREEEARARRAPRIASTVEGSAEAQVCLGCGKKVSAFHLLTDGTVRCKGCC